MGVVRECHNIRIHTNQNFSFMCCCAYIFIVWVWQTTFINSFITFCHCENDTLLMSSSTRNDFVDFVATMIFVLICVVDIVFIARIFFLTWIRSSIIIHIKRFSTEFFIFNLFKWSFLFLRPTVFNFSIDHFSEFQWNKHEEMVSSKEIE